MKKWKVRVKRSDKPKRLPDMSLFFQGLTMIVLGVLIGWCMVKIDPIVKDITPAVAFIVVGLFGSIRGLVGFKDDECYFEYIDDSDEDSDDDIK
nr:MAG TPA: hypothetical protein [Caudoviricetes sp.]